MTWPKSSGSMRADSAIDPTKSGPGTAFGGERRRVVCRHLEKLSRLTTIAHRMHLGDCLAIDDKPRQHAAVMHTVRVSTSSVQDHSTHCNPATTDSLPRLSTTSGVGSSGCRGISNFRNVRFAELRRVISCVRRSKIVVDLSGPSTRSNCSAASQRTRSRIVGWDGRVTS